MGSSDTTVVSRVAVGGPACTRLPGVTSALLTRPAMGDRTRVHSRLSLAVSTAASAPRTAASALAWPLVRLSYSSREIACTSTNRWARSTSLAARDAAVRNDCQGDGRGRWRPRGFAATADEDAEPEHAVP